MSLLPLKLTDSSPVRSMVPLFVQETKLKQNLQSVSSINTVERVTFANTNSVIKTGRGNPSVCCSLGFLSFLKVRHRWCELIVKHKYTKAYKDVERFLQEDQVSFIFSGWEFL